MEYHRRKGFMSEPVEHECILCTRACTLQASMLKLCCLVVFEKMQILNFSPEKGRNCCLHHQSTVVVDL